MNILLLIFVPNFFSVTRKKMISVEALQYHSRMVRNRTENDHGGNGKRGKRTNINEQSASDLAREVHEL